MVQYIKQYQEDSFRIDLHETYLNGCILKLRSEWTEATTCERDYGRAMQVGKILVQRPQDSNSFGNWNEPKVGQCVWDICTWSASYLYAILIFYQYHLCSMPQGGKHEIKNDKVDRRWNRYSFMSQNFVLPWYNWKPCVWSTEADMVLVMIQ